MGIINLTPDSFSDGGDNFSVDKSLRQVSNFVSSGVDIVDLGAQSTRPGAVEISPQEEIARLIPSLDAIRKNFPDLLISIDTFNSDVALAALEHGADWVNDVTGGRRDAELINVVSRFECPYVLTHSRGNSQTMNSLNIYDDLLKEIIESLLESTNYALEKKVSRDKIIWDPGIGFSKDTIQNIEVLKNLNQLKEFGYPILIGASRKRFIGDILNEKDPKERDVGTLAVTSLCAQIHIHAVRVHNVRLNSQFLKIADNLFR